MTGLLSRRDRYAYGHRRRASGLLAEPLPRNVDIQVPDALSELTIAPICEAVTKLHNAGIPLPFAFLYDQPWLAFQSISRFLTASLGADYRMLPDFWVWYVSPNETPPDGGRTALASNRDQRFVERGWDGEGNNVVYQPQDIRALPATAGSLLAWNQGLLHWGSRGSRLGTGPRISAAVEFQRSDVPAFNVPLLDPYRVPTFEERLGLIGKQILQYRHMYPLTDDVANIALSLAGRYMPEALERLGLPNPSAVATAV